MRSNYAADEHCHVTRTEIYSPYDGTYYVHDEPHKRWYRKTQKEVLQVRGRQRATWFERLGRYFLEDGYVADRQWHYAKECINLPYDTAAYEEMKGHEDFCAKHYEAGKKYYEANKERVSKFVPNVLF